MRDILETLTDEWRGGKSVALATVVQTWNSAPRPPGTSLIVTGDGAVQGSVSGGCVEGAVYETSTAILGGAPQSLERYGVSNDDAFAVGLTCGGTIDIFIQDVNPQTWPDLPEIAQDIEAGRSLVIAQVVEHPDAELIGERIVVRQDTPVPPSPGPNLASSPPSDPAERLRAHITADAHGLLEGGEDQTLTYGADGERTGSGVRVFCWVLTPPPRMIIFGAIDFAGSVADIGSFLGFDVTVCDAREVFATSARFPSADRVIVEWPNSYLQAELDADRLDSRTVLVVLTHDPKFDVPLLDIALRHDGFAYIGAMGSRRTHEDRLDRLREQGLGDTELGRLHSPIGLDIGGSTPQEVAVAIAAEIIGDKHGRTGRSLRATSGALH